MLIPQVFVDLAERGVTLAAAPHAVNTGGDAIDVRHPIVLAGPGFGPTRWDVRIFSESPRPSRLLDLRRNMLAHASSHQLLLLVPSASQELLDAAASHGVSVLVAPDREDQPTTGFLIPPTGPTIHLDAPRTKVRVRSAGPKPWIKYAVAFELLRGNPSTQVDIAAQLDVTQGRVSQVIHQLQRTLNVEPGGWHRGQPQLLEWLAANYERPSLTSTWLTLQPVVATAKELAQRWEANNTSTAVTGEVAADALAPYENPSMLMLYSAHQNDLSVHGLVPSPPSSANVLLAQPDDPFVLRRTRLTSAGYSVVEPWRVVVDLLQTGARQAATALIDALRVGRVAG